MSIINKSGVGIEEYRTGILKSLPPIVEKNGYDMIGQELHPYDWVIIVGASFGSVDRRIGFVKKITAKKVTVMTYSVWGYKNKGDISPSSISSNNLIKISEDQIKVFQGVSA